MALSNLQRAELWRVIENGGKEPLRGMSPLETCDGRVSSVTLGRAVNGAAVVVAHHCDKEWCPVCGKEWSLQHKRRAARVVERMGGAVSRIGLELTVTPELEQLTDPALVGPDLADQRIRVLLRAAYRTIKDLWPGCYFRLRLHWMGGRKATAPQLRFRWRPHVHAVIGSDRPVRMQRQRREVCDLWNLKIRQGLRGLGITLNTQITVVNLDSPRDLADNQQWVGLLAYEQHPAINQLWPWQGPAAWPEWVRQGPTPEFTADRCKLIYAALARGARISRWHGKSANPAPLDQGHGLGRMQLAGRMLRDADGRSVDPVTGLAFHWQHGGERAWLAWGEIQRRNPAWLELCDKVWYKPEWSGVDHWRSYGRGEVQARIPGTNRTLAPGQQGGPGSAEAEEGGWWRDWWSGGTWPTADQAGAYPDPGPRD